MHMRDNAVSELSPAQIRSEEIRQELGFPTEKWAAMNRQERRAAARRYRTRVRRDNDGPSGRI
jgi:hypothetical protein